MSAEHTPAPWSTRLASDGSGDIGIIAGGHCIAECFLDIRVHGEGAHDECSANARLIAAAPDMLTALQAIRNAVGALPEGLEGYLESLDEPVAMVRQAIARATTGAEMREASHG